MNVKQNLEEYMKTLSANNHFNGTVLVAHKDEILLNRGYGLSSYEYEIPNTPQTKFRVGSISKAFTAVAILLLCKGGKINLSDKIQLYLHDFPNGEYITIHHLLTHSSGIADFTFSLDYWEKLMRLPSSLEKSINLIKNEPLQFQPGDRMEYRNTGYLLLSAIIEKASGMSYEKFLQENIFNPLELRNTGVDNGRTVVKNLATGYSVWEEIIHTEFVDMSIPLGAYGIYSTVEDLYAWGQALKKGLLLDEDLTNRMFTSYLGGYGYGWYIEDTPRKHACHFGDINGFVNNFLLYLEDDVTVVVLSNINITPVVQISNALTKIIFKDEIQFPTKMEQLMEDLPVKHLIGEYKGEHETIAIDCEKSKWFVTIPRTYGVVYKYELKCTSIERDKAYFRSDFVDEWFVFNRNEEEISLQYINVNKSKVTLNKI